MPGLERGDACFRQLRTEAKLVALFAEGVAALRSELDRGQLAAQAGYAGIHGTSSLVAVTLSVSAVGLAGRTLFRRRAKPTQGPDGSQLSVQQYRRWSRPRRP